jgi:hypothetical protein
VAKKSLMTWTPASSPLLDVVIKVVVAVKLFLEVILEGDGDDDDDAADDKGDDDANEPDVDAVVEKNRLQFFRRTNKYNVHLIIIVLQQILPMFLASKADQLLRRNFLMPIVATASGKIAPKYATWRKNWIVKYSEKFQAKVGEREQHHLRYSLYSGSLAHCSDWLVNRSHWSSHHSSQCSCHCSCHYSSHCSSGYLS